ncbi:MAG TPA: trigger factor, partial [Anaerolineae bacterium]
MTLTIHTEETDQRQLKMTIEVAEERVQQAMRDTARQIARDITIPGFRKGKVPYNVLVRRVGREALRAEAIEEIVPSIFEEALEQVDPDVYGQPSLDNLESEPLVLKFTVPLTPQVELGDYRSMRKEIEPVLVSDEAVEEALEQVRVRHQVLEPVDRPVEGGDAVTVSGKGWVTLEEEVVEAEATTEEAEASEEVAEAEATTEEAEAPEEVAEAPEAESHVTETAEAETAGIEERVIFDEERIDLLMDRKKLFSGTPFVENLIGLSTGDTTSFSFVFPEGFEDEELAGEEATFNITILDVKNRELPELDDELAKQEGDYETVEELREAIRKNLQEQAEEQARDEILESTIDALLADARLVYPPTTVESEIDDMVENYKDQVTRSGWQWEDFLQLQGTTEADLREDFREAAVQRLERRLILRQFILEEKLTVELADIDAAIEERV